MSVKEDSEVDVAESSKDFPRGPSGIVGTATAGKTIKQRWHEATHVLMDVGNRHNPRKQAWVKKAGAPSLKRFARQAAQAGDQAAKDWFDHKVGSMNASRSDSNRMRANLERQASKASRRKSTASKAKKPTETV